MPGVFPQDLMTVLASLLVILLAIRWKENATAQLIILGVMGYLFYTYGIYVIERVYNSLYLIYMAVFGLAFYAMIYGVGSLRRELLAGIRLPTWLRHLDVEGETTGTGI